MLRKTAVAAVIGIFCLFVLKPPQIHAKGFFWKDPHRGNMGGGPEEIALDFLSANPQLFFAQTTEELTWLKTHTLKNISYVRFQQVHRDIVVEGAQVVVTVDPIGRIYQLSDSTMEPALLPEPRSCLSPEEAEAAVYSQRPHIVVEDVRGPVYVGAAQDGGLAYLAQAVRVRTHNPFGLWEAYVDCSNGSIVGVKSLLVHADGYVYDPSPAVNPIFQRVTLENLESTTNLEGSLAAAYACSGARCDTVVQNAVADMDGNFLYEPDEPSIEDAFSEVNGYYHTNKISTWFDTELGYTKICRGSRRVNVVVNMNYPNAFYGDMDRDGCGDIVFGQDMAPPGVDFAYDGDVVYHEFTHGVVEDTAELWGMRPDELGWDSSSGGLNEGTADYFAVTITDHPVLGDYALGAYGGELMARNADNDDVCPDDLVGESHYDGEIWTGTLWEIRTAIGAHKTDELVMAVLYSLTSTADFDEAGNALITQAGILESSGTLDAGDAATVESIANARGLPGCERIIFLEDGEMGMSYMFGTEEWGSWIDEIPSGIQFAVVAPPNAVRVILRLYPMAYGTLDFDAYVNFDAPIGFVRSGFEPVVNDYEYIVTGSPTNVSWTTFSDPLISPGTTYYVTFISRCPYGLLLSVEATIVTGDLPEEPPEEVDAVEDVIEEDISQEDLMEEDIEEETTVDAGADAAGDPEEDVPDGKIVKEGCGCEIVM